MIYFICFILSIILLILINKINLSLNIKKLVYIISIMPVIILAMFREDTIGIDVLVYVKRYFILACNSASFWQYNKIIKTEFGYKVINFLVSRFSSDLVWMHGINQLLAIIPIYLTCKMNKKIMPIWLGMACYYFMFFNVSLNAVRQAIACAWVLYGITNIIYKKHKKGIMFFGIGVSFHYTAVFSTLIILVYFLTRKKYVNKLFILFISCIMLLISFDFTKIYLFFSKYVPILRERRYLNYLNSNEITSGIGNTYIVLKIICIIIALLLCYKKINININNFLLVLQLVSLLLIPISFQINFGYRLLRYVDYFTIMLLPQIYYLFKANKLNKGVGYVLTLICILGYWLLTYEIQNNGGTVPYLFK